MDYFECLNYGIFEFFDMFEIVMLGQLLLYFWYDCVKDVVIFEVLLLLVCYVCDCYIRVYNENFRISEGSELSLF